MRLKELIWLPINPADKLVICRLDKVKKAVQNIPTQEELEKIVRNPELYVAKKKFIIDLDFKHPYINGLHKQIDGLKEQVANLKESLGAVENLAKKDKLKLKKIKNKLLKITTLFHGKTRCEK